MSKDTPTNTPTNTPTQNQFTNSELKQIEEMARDICECFNNNGTCYQDDKPCDCKCDSFTDAQYLYEKGYRKQEWISVDERLPEREGKYLVCTTNGNIGVGNFIDYYGKGTHLCFACWAVTHWMPLPEAPKMKG